VQNFKGKRILVCPLDWGLGHATRCIPLIRKFIADGAIVFIAAPESIKLVLLSEFPNLSYLDIFGYEVSYSSTLPLWFKLSLQAPRIHSLIQKEHEWLKQIQQELQIDVVISDNRYGLYTMNAYCIFVTHQLFIPSPIFPGAVNKRNHEFISKYNECWIPDYEGNDNLSGDLSHGKHSLKNVQFIGPLSRFNKEMPGPEKIYSWCVVLSGPEPQRSILEKKLLQKLHVSGKKTVFVRGILHEEKPIEITSNIEVHSFLSGTELQKKLQESEMVICRSGYSSIMDLAALDLKGILIPTPGQSEQEYLAEYLNGKRGWRSVKQNELEQLHL
jgi:hypothetical protein